MLRPILENDRGEGEEEEEEEEKKNGASVFSILVTGFNPIPFQFDSSSSLTNFIVNFKQDRAHELADSIVYRRDRVEHSLEEVTFPAIFPDPPTIQSFARKRYSMLCHFG